MHKSSSRLLLAISAIWSLTLHAQTASTASDEVVKLSDFNVTESSSHQYAATESMTGSRVATEIKDLPFSINVVTNEMLQDFGIFEIGDNINQFVPGFSNLDQGGSYNLRGFNASFQLRDGFFRLGRYSSSNIDRIEIINGSNAAIYGAASPGGLVNMISKAPKRETTATVSVSVGNYETDRETVETTGTIAKNTYYILDLGLYERAYANQYGHDRNKEFYYALKHDFSSSTALTLQYEFADRRQHSPPSAVVQVQNASVPGYAAAGVKAVSAYTGLDINEGRIDQGGPFTMLDRSEGFLTGIFEHRFDDVWSLRTGANLYSARRWDFGQNLPGATEVIATTGVATIQRASAPTQHDIFEDGGGIQNDLLASYKLFGGKVSAKTLFTLDFNDYYRDAPTWSIAGQDLATYWTPIRTITVGQPISYYQGPGYNTEFPYTGGNGTQTTFDKNRASDWGGLVRQQFYAFDDKLRIFFGVRSDYVIERDRSYLTSPVYPYNHNVEHYLTPNVGFSYSINPSVSLFANYSTGFNPNSQSITASTFTGLVPGETDYGYDYGIKVATPNGKFSSTFDAYYAMRYNVAVSVLDPTTGLTTTQADGNQLVRGFELTDYWFPTPNITLYAFWGHINSKYRSYGEQYMTVGRTPKLITPDNIGITLRYGFDGDLKGLATGFNISYMRATPLNAGNAGDTYGTNGLLASSTYQWAVMIPSYYVANWFATYSFKTPYFTRLKSKLQVNVNNLFNRNYIVSTGVIGDSRGAYIGYTLSY